MVVSDFWTINSILKPTKPWRTQDSSAGFTVRDVKLTREVFLKQVYIFVAMVSGRKLQSPWVKVKKKHTLEKRTTFVMQEKIDGFLHDICSQHYIKLSFNWCEIIWDHLIKVWFFNSCSFHPLLRRSVSGGNFGGLKWASAAKNSHVGSKVPAIPSLPGRNPAPPQTSDV